MGRRDRDERPSIEVVGAEGSLTSVHHVSTGGPNGPRRPGTRGLLVGAVVVGLLLVGLALGDDDGGPTASQALEEDAQDSTSTTRRRTTTSRPRSTTTTSTTSTIPAGPVFAGQQVSGWLLVGSSQAGWTLVDIETGAQSEPELPFDNPYSTRRVEGGVVIIRGRQAEYHDLRVPAGVREPVELGQADQILTSGRPDQVWLVDSGGLFEQATEGNTTASLVDLSGRVLRSFAVPSGYLAGASPEGLLFERGGRVYVVDEEGVRPVATGQVVGAVGDLMLLFTCDDEARCGAEVRAASGRGGRRLPIEGSLDGGFELSSHVDGRFAVTAYSANGGVETALFDADGSLISNLGLDLSLSGPLSWLPGDAGLVGALNGQVVWIRRMGDKWVVQEPPALEGLQADGVVAIGR